MLKQILIQLWNRRKANAWILVELLLVFCLMWYVVDYFCVLGYNRSLPSHRNLDHTWRVTVDLLPEEAPDYKPGESDSTALEKNYERILDRISRYTDVESYTVTHQTNSPGDGSMNCYPYRNRQDTSLTGQIVTLSFDYRTDYFQVFRYTTPGGKPVSLKDFDWSGPHDVVICGLTGKTFFPGQNPVGRVLESVNLPDEYMQVKGVVGQIKRFDYERPFMCAYKPIRLDAGNIMDMEIAVRSRESVSDANFLESFKEAMKHELRIGNFYLYNIQSYNDRMDYQDVAFGMTRDIQIRESMMLFFLVNTILCVIGTFWYRIRVRRDEIGLRMAMGSSRAGIRGLFIGEGLCLLAVVTLPALFIEVQFVYAGLIETLGQYKDNMGYLPDKIIVRFILTNCLTWLILAVAIVVAIWLPAGKAANLAPADALHYE